MSDVLSLAELCALPDDSGDMGRGACVYFLWKGPELLYIGATISRGVRIPRHYYEKRYGYSTAGVCRPIPFDRVTFLNCERDGMWDLEYAYQTAYTAPYNVYGLQKRFV